MNRAPISSRLALVRNAQCIDSISHRILFFITLSISLGMGMAAPRSALASEPPMTAPRGKVEWKSEWDRFTPNEGGITVAATVLAYTLDKKLPDYPKPVMDFEVPLLDPGARGLFRARSEHGQHVFAQWGDLGFRTIVLFPYIVDVGIVATVIHHNVDVAAQLALIDLESLTLAGVTQLFTSRMTSRTRPFVQDCADDGRSTSHQCGDTREHRSFYGGHASAAFTSAGLTCIHHQHIPLYGGGAPDAWACAWALTFASFISATRVVADEHWASDTVIGIGTGWFYGYLLPKWLHYGTKRATAKGIGLAPRDKQNSGEPDRTVFLAPLFKPVDDGGVLGVTGVF